MQSHLQTSYYERVLGWIVWDLTICSRPFCWKEVLNACPCCLSGTRLLSTSVLSSSLSQATKKGVGLRVIYHFWRNHKIVCTFTGLKFCATHVWTVVPQSLKFYTTYNSNETLPVFRGYGSETDSCITCVRLYHAHACACAPPVATWTCTRRMLSACLQTDFARTQLHGNHTTHVALCAVTSIEP